MKRIRNDERGTMKEIDLDELKANLDPKLLRKKIAEFELGEDGTITALILVDGTRLEGIMEIKGNE